MLLKKYPGMNEGNVAVFKRKWEVLLTSSLVVLFTDIP